MWQFIIGIIIGGGFGMFITAICVASNNNNDNNNNNNNNYKST